MVPCKVKGRPKIALDTNGRARVFHLRVSAARAHYTIIERAAPLGQGCGRARGFGLVLVARRWFADRVAIC